MSIPFYSSKEVASGLHYHQLISALKKGLQSDLMVPQRMHYHLDYQLKELDPTLLIMPAWKSQEYIGIKIVTIFPSNKYLPTIQGIYLLMDGRSGQNLALMDAKLLTLKRTAATSAMMSTFLSRADAKVLLMIGTGNLALELIKAHCTERPIEQILVWGRNPAKAKKIVAELKSSFLFPIRVCENLQQGCASADIISTATMSSDPVVYGRWVKKGTHVDLVGSYKPNMREADDELLTKSSIFVDTIEGATKESGDLFIPLSDHVVQLSDLKGTMYDLCSGLHPGRKNPEEITLFKSVGHASEDLIAAYTLHEKLSADES